jgi:hypothetical protein
MSGSLQRPTPIGAARLTFLTPFEFFLGLNLDPWNMAITSNGGRFEDS